MSSQWSGKLLIHNPIFWVQTLHEFSFFVFFVLILDLVLDNHANALNEILKTPPSNFTPSSFELESFAFFFAFHFRAPECCISNSFNAHK